VGDCARLRRFIYLVTLAEFIVLHGKSYYLAPAYTMLFAAGGVAVERIFAARLKWIKPVFLGVMIATGALCAPLMLPILPPEEARHVHADHSHGTAAH
jgi:hypothetical protein